METCDIVVIGAGPGGYVAAVHAARLGAKVALIEKEDIGGLCLNWGCIPSKILLKNASTLSRMNHFKEKGLVRGDFSPDFSSLVAHSRERVGDIKASLTNLITSAGISIIKGTAYFETSDTISIASENGQTITIKAREGVIIATGSRARTLPTINVDGTRVITSKEALALTKQPETLAIIGGGVIGCEMATFFAALGTKVTIFEYMPQLLSGIDADISKGLGRCFKRAGIDIRLSTDITKTSVEAENILIAIGIEPNIESLKLKNVGIDTMPGRGFILVDPYTYQTNIARIYAIGDVIALRGEDLYHPALAHVASAEGEIAVENILHGRCSWHIDYEGVPLAIFTEPEIGIVGLTEEKAKEKYHGHTIISQQLRDAWMGIGLALEETEGITKLIIDETKYGQILGAHIFGPAATERIHIFAAARRAQESAHLMDRQLYAHPTFSEGTRETLLALKGKSVHMPLAAQEGNRKKRQ